MPPVIYHFKRVVGPLCAPVSKNHPHQLAGLYKGLYGPHGCEMLSVGYDFSGRSAQIVARKLTGRFDAWMVGIAGPPWQQLVAQGPAMREQVISRMDGTGARLQE